LTEAKDPYNQGEKVNIDEIIHNLFMIDSRLYKHYHILAWFPKYFRLYYETQVLIMDNNQGGNSDLHNESECSIFPPYINYYIAIMAVSCYRCEYLLYLL